MSFFKRRRSASGHCFPNPKRVNQEKTGDIKALIREKNVERINELIKQDKIFNFRSLANDIYDCHGSFEFLSELDIDSNDLIKTANGYAALQIRYMFIEQVTSIKFEDLYENALKSNDIEFISRVAIIGLTHNDASFNHVFTLAQHVIATKEAKDIYNFANSVLSSAINHYTKSDYRELAEALENAIIETEDTNYIAKFAQDIEGADKEKLIKAVINAKKDNSNKESNNSKEENDATREIINLAIESNAMYIDEVIAQIIKTNNIDLIINLAYCLILNNVDKDFIIDFAQRVKETKNTDCMYEIIKVVKDFPNKELRDLLIDELIQAITNLKDLKHSALLTKEYQTISQESLHKLFLVIMEAFEILDAPMDKVERILAKLVLFEVLDETSLKCFISYMNFKAGILLPPVNNLSELGDELFIGGRQYQLVKPDKNNQIKGA